MSQTNIPEWRARLAAYLRKTHGAAGTHTAAKLPLLDLEATVALRSALDRLSRACGAGGFRTQEAYDAAVLSAVAGAVRHIRTIQAATPAPRRVKRRGPEPQDAAPFDRPPFIRQVDRYVDTLLRLPL